MAHIVIMGAGIGGVPMAYEMRDAAGKDDTISVVSNTPTFHFTPSNPWVAVNWRTREDIEITLEPVLCKRNIGFSPVGVAKVHPKENRLELLDGSEILYDYLIIATGPALAFDEIEGFGPHGGLTQSVCHVDHAVEAAKAWETFCANPGPIVVGATQGASCFGPAYEFAAIMDTDLRRRKIRDKVPMTFITPEPYIGHLGLDGVGDSRGMMEGILRSHHINWICNARIEKFADGAAHALELDEDGKEKKRHVVPFAYSMMLPPTAAFRR